MKNQIKFHEKQLQYAAQKLMADPSRVFMSLSGDNLQILSPGRINVSEGPDYLDMAIFIRGKVIVGNAEFHKKSSDWLEHFHSNNPLYDSVVLHIVLENDAQIPINCDTLILNYDEIYDIVVSKSFTTENEQKLDSIEELQHYSLLRLLRKSSESAKHLKKYNLREVFTRQAKEFITNFQAKKRRPSYDEERLMQLLAKLPFSLAYQFLDSIYKSERISVPDEMHSLLKSKILDEGAGLRQEIILNVVLPIAICLSDESTRIDLFLWYWSTPALSQYGVLTRRFKDFPQNFLWQQQGMLEYIREYGKKSNVVTEAIKEYGFNETLNFYHIGNSPFKTV